MRAGDIFTVVSNPQLNKESFDFSDDAPFPYFTRTVSNNGIAGYVKYLDEEHKIKGNALAVGMLGMQFFYMEKDFYAGQFTKTVRPNKSMKKFNKLIAQYFIALLNRYQKTYQSVLVRNFEAKFLQSELLLPFKNGQIAFSYMENYISILQVERLSVLQSYLHQEGFWDLSDEDAWSAINPMGGGGNLNKINNLQTLAERLRTLEQDFLANGGEFRDVEMAEIFTITTPKKKFDANKVKFGGKHPYVARGDKNNGIRGYLDEDENFLNDGNTISFGQDTATMFYQKDDYFTGDKIKVFSEKTGALNNKNAQYIIAAMQRAFSLFSWGSSSFNEKILQKTVMILPFIENKPAFSYMENYIQTLQNFIMRDVVAYVARELAQLEKV